MMDVEYNGILASSLGIYAKNIPDIPVSCPKRKDSGYSWHGRNADSVGGRL